MLSEINPTLKYKGKVVRLNQRLIAQKELTVFQVEAIKEIHKARIEVELLMERTDDNGELGIYAEEWRKLQERLQAAWGFEVNRDWHRFWEMPKCACAALDNTERLGTPYKVYNTHCPIHGID